MAASLIGSTLLAADETTPAAGTKPASAEAVRFFETSVRPLLVAQCFECHGEKKQWGSLRLDSRDALLKGGDRGPAVVPGKPDESLLIQAVRQTDDDFKMPPEPKSKLTDRQIADLTKWIRDGAVFPASTVAKGRTRDRNHWAFQPPKPAPLPDVKAIHWPQTPLDRFVLARLEAAGISPATPADKQTLIRRATFDLTGLPPTPEEIDAFLEDDRPDAFARVVDRLLDSPSYGERWGRHWLDVARYADSNGLDENVCHGNAWRYRDYVVASLNADKPFDRFATEQLAGDLLSADAATETEAARYERLIATGFLSIGPKVLAEVDETKMEMDIVDEQVETFGRVFLGMTFGCARCHDHKFDPVSTADYYGLAGVFKSTKSMDSFTKVAKWHENETPTPESRAARAAFDAQVAERKAAVQKAIDAANEALKAAKPGEALPEKPETLYPEPTKAELKKLRDELAAFEKTAPEAPSAMGVVEGKPTDLAIHLRGSHLKLGDVVSRRVPEIFPAAAPMPKEGSGRMQVARWLFDAGNPLAARVLANRVWRWHVGKGLAASVDNFGLLGEKPSHPELLDHLALEIQRPGAGGAWSLKRLHRTILLSATWQQSSVPAPGAAERDPENRLFSRADVRRLEAEAIRDALISVGGRLDRTFGGSLLTHVKNRGYFFDHTSKDLTDYRSWRRSLYLPIVRNNVHDVFQLLDYPDPAVPTGDRASTTVAPQALLMLNSDLVMQCSEALVDRLLREAPVDEAARFDRLSRLCYGRPATEAETAAARAWLAELDRSLVSSEPDAARRARTAWEALCQTALASNEFIYVR